MAQDQQSVELLATLYARVVSDSELSQEEPRTRGGARTHEAFPAADHPAFAPEPPPGVKPAANFPLVR